MHEHRGLFRDHARRSENRAATIECAGSLTNIGSLIAAGNSATISVADPVVNEAQTLNAYWHLHWVQETGDFSLDKRHHIRACGPPEQCTTIYSDAYTKAGGAINPPTSAGNIAMTS